MHMVFQLAGVVAYFYFIYQMSCIERGIGKAIVLFLLSFTAVVIAEIFDMAYIGWIIVTLFFVFYDLFFDEEIFRFQWKKIVAFGTIVIAGEILIQQVPIFSELILTEILCLFMFYLFSWKRSYLRVFNVIGVSTLYLGIIIMSLLIRAFKENVFLDVSYARVAEFSLLLIGLLLFFILEVTHLSYRTGYEKGVKSFQQNLILHQYEEMKKIYLNMRGWRHDYHNHIQVIKAHLALGQLDNVTHYLIELERDLERVDIFIKSGNQMVDAILNSKLSLADKAQITIHCKAEVPEILSVTEIDLCVILGNLLDNAVEACEKIERNKRFLRVYIAVIKKQLYISVQNSAKEDLDFKEKNYITNKRGNHGLGMKRVKILIEKYDGYLNLQNEPGVFAAEVTLPLQ